MVIKLTKVTASAPGKVALFGEHAVVYGHQAMAGAIDRRVHVTVEQRSDDLIKIHAMDLSIPGIVLTIGGLGKGVSIETDYVRIMDAVGYIRKAIEVTSSHCGIKKGINVHIKSEMPVGAGLGTSAAVSVATILAYSAAMGHALKSDEVSALGHKVELEVQGAASPMDTAVATHGGILLIRPLIGKASLTPVKVEQGLPLVVGYTPRECGTGEMLRRVRNLRDAAPESVDSILCSIGKVVSEADSAMRSGDLRRVGMLMNVNHGLLESLGVSTKKLNEMVYSARSAGALGSKLTGAGGGGCAIALCPGREQDVMTALSLAGGTACRSSISGKGACIEKGEGS